MPPQKSDEEIIDIVQDYLDTGSNEAERVMKEVVAESDHAKGTVSKYVNEWRDGNLTHLSDLPPPPGAQAEKDPGEWRDEGYSAEPFSTGDDKYGDDRPNFAEMGYGEFVKWFYEQDGFGVDGGWKNRMARTCQVRNSLPDKAEMSKALIQQNSRISNHHDADALAEIYWDAAQDFLEAKGEMPRSAGSPHSPSGSWQSAESGSGGSSADEMTGGSWVGGDQGGQQGQPTPNGGRPQAGAPSGQPMAQGQGQGGMSPQVMELIADLKDTQAKMAQELNRQQHQNGESGSPLEQLEELASIQDKIQQIQGGNQQPEAIDQIKAQMQQLRQEMNQQQQDGGPVPVGAGADGGGMIALAQLASQGDIDDGTLGILAESMGVTDPDIEREKHKTQRLEMKYEKRAELLDNFLEGAQDISGEAVGGLFDALFGDDDEDGQSDDREGGRGGDRGGGQGRQPGEPVRAQQPEGGLGELQVVGETVGGDSDDDSSGKSPAAQRLEEIDSGGGGPGGEFRGPTDQPRSDEHDHDVGHAIDGCQWVLPDGSVCGQPVEGDGVYCSNPNHSQEAM